MGIIVGIDPCYKGGIVFLHRDRSLEVFDMPTLKNKKGKVELDLLEIARLLKPTLESRYIAGLEKVGVMPGQGISSAFRFGEGVGALRMALTGHGYELHYPTPAVWKKHFKLSRDKGVSRSLAMERFPNHARAFSRVKDDGRAEAALIALYLRETLVE